jgi:hypothetical protein
MSLVIFLTLGNELSVTILNMVAASRCFVNFLSPVFYVLAILLKIKEFRTFIEYVTIIGANGTKIRPK